MIRRHPKLLRGRLADNRGVTTVEFALLATPFLLLIVGGLDTAHQSYIRSVISGALGDAARRAAVQKPDFVSLGATTEERVTNALKNQINPVAPNATIAVTIQNFEDFTGINKPEKLMTDNNGNGNYDAGDHDCFEDLNSNGQYDVNAGRSGVGSASDVVKYNVKVTLPHLMPWKSFLGGSNTYAIEASTVMRNQPYATNATPPVICG